MNIKQIQEEGVHKLKEANIEEAMLKAKLLLAYLLDKPKEYLMIHSEEDVSEEMAMRYRDGIERLLRRVPIAYIIGHREFMKLDFYVNEHVLIPRADTEILVETVLEIGKKEKTIKVLDLCTGSGAIAISIAKYLPNSKVTGIDISKEAIEVAIENAKKNEVAVSFIESDLYENVQKQEWDMIVSNPPYIESEVIATLEPEVQNEPEIALNGGKDGLDFYRRIINQAPKYLKKGGWLALEIGYQQAKKVTELLEIANCYDKIDVKKDLGGNDRVVVTTYTGAVNETK